MYLLIYKNDTKLELSALICYYSLILISITFKFNIYGVIFLIISIDYSDNLYQLTIAVIDSTFSLC